MQEKELYFLKDIFLKIFYTNKMSIIHHKKDIKMYFP
jgi:hypothetical protein